LEVVEMEEMLFFITHFRSTCICSLPHGYFTL